MIKSRYLKNKYNCTENNNFYIYYYNPINKSVISAKILRLMHLNNLKRLVLPSSFKLVQKKNVQGPRIEIIYSFNLNFKQLPYLCLLKATSFKLKNKWYAYQLLEDLKHYKEATNLCLNVDHIFKRKNIELFQYFQSFALKKQGNLVNIKKI